jgi:hypothetical protein
MARKPLTPRSLKRESYKVIREEILLGALPAGTRRR